MSEQLGGHLAKVSSSQQCMSFSRKRDLMLSCITLTKKHKLSILMSTWSVQSVQFWHSPDIKVEYVS